MFLSDLFLQLKQQFLGQREVTFEAIHEFNHTGGADGVKVSGAEPEASLLRGRRQDLPQCGLYS
ncbi:MAG: hypothetical protein QF752_01475 [Planctomycetota bacterium]|nr:hypothetical protein [Planctomycetota bacterium]